jgi:hypothetical protein
MIDRITGEIRFPTGSIRICPSLSREEFLSSAIGNQSHLNVRNEPYCSFDLPIVQFDGHKFGWSLWFYGSLLQRVSITCIDSEFGSSWSDWSEKLEIARQSFHEKVLQLSLGDNRKQQKLSWGNISSGFDPKSGNSSIEVTYSRIVNP